MDAVTLLPCVVLNTGQSPWEAYVCLKVGKSRLKVGIFQFNDVKGKYICSRNQICRENCACVCFYPSSHCLSKVQDSLKTWATDINMIWFEHPWILSHLCTDFSSLLKKKINLFVILYIYKHHILSDERSVSIHLWVWAPVWLLTFIPYLPNSSCDVRDDGGKTRSWPPRTCIFFLSNKSTFKPLCLKAFLIIFF